LQQIGVMLEVSTVAAGTATATAISAERPVVQS